MGESTPSKDEESSSQINVTGTPAHTTVHPQEAASAQIAKMNKADGGDGDDIVDPNYV